MKRVADGIHHLAWSQVLESEQQSEECGAKGKAFTLLHESDTLISAALEHSDRLQQHSFPLHQRACSHYGSTPNLKILHHFIFDWRVGKRSKILDISLFLLIYPLYWRVTPNKIKDFTWQAKKLKVQKKQGLEV